MSKKSAFSNGTANRVTASTSGDLVVELETHKAIVEVRAGQPAVLRQVLSEAGKWQQIGLPLALLSDDAGEPLPEEVDSAADLMVDFEIT